MKISKCSNKFGKSEGKKNKQTEVCGIAATLKKLGRPYLILCFEASPPTGGIQSPGFEMKKNQEI